MLTVTVLLLTQMLLIELNLYSFRKYFFKVSVIVVSCDIQLLVLVECEGCHTDSTELPHQSEAQRAVMACERKSFVQQVGLIVCFFLPVKDDLKSVLF